MRMCFQAGFICLLILSGPTCFCEEKAETPRDLFEKQQVTYQKELQKIMQDEIAGIEDVGKKYVEKLKVLEKKFQNDGLLDPLLAVKKEIERFQSEKKIPDHALVREFPETAAVQNEYFAGVKTARLETARRIIALAGLYEKSLKDLEVEFTKKGEVDLAIEVRKHREGISTREDFVKARTLVAEATPPPARETTAPLKVAPESVKQQIAKKPVGTVQAEVGARIAEFFKAVLTQNWQAAAEFVSPDVIKAKGKTSAQGSVMARFSLAKYGATRGDIKYQWGVVEVSDDQENATVPLKLLVRDKWHTLPKMSWVQSNNAWFIQPDPESGDKN